MNQSVFQEALNKISERRQRARVENERRHQEIDQKIPEIAEVNYQLAQTSLKILMGEDIEILKRQNLQAQRYCSQLLINHGYPADYLDMHYTCEKCQDTGYFEGRYCSCLEKLISSINTENMNRISQLKLCNFNQFSLEYYKNITVKDENNPEKTIECYSEMEKVLRHCKQYATNFKLNSPSLLLYGNPGLGKTHLSLSIVTEVLNQGYEVIYDSICNLLSKIESEHFQHEKPEISTLDILLETDLLVLDDLGTEFHTSFTESVIYNIINTRINHHLPTIINTNLTHTQLNNLYETRIVSRLFAIYKPLHIVGKDIRMMKKKNNQNA